MKETPLTVEDLMMLLQRKVSKGEIERTHRIVWNHKEWGIVDICDVVFGASIVEAAGDSGYTDCAILKPMKHIPLEATDRYFDIAVRRVAPEIKIAAIKAFRAVSAECTTAGDIAMGLAEAKQAVESITPEHPFIFSHVLPRFFEKCKGHLNIRGLEYQLIEHGKADALDEEIIPTHFEDGTDPATGQPWATNSTILQRNFLRSTKAGVPANWLTTLLDNKIEEEDDIPEPPF